MRLELKNYEGKKCNCVGTINDIGLKIKRIKRQYQNSITLLLTNVLVNNEINIEHIWINYNGINNFKKGDKIEFESIITKYIKRGNKEDWNKTEFGNIIKHTNDFGFTDIENIKIIE